MPFDWKITRDRGIVNLSEIGLTDPPHTQCTTGSSPSSWGAISRSFVNLTVPHRGRRTDRRSRMSWWLSARGWWGWTFRREGPVQ